MGKIYENNNKNDYCGSEYAVSRWRINSAGGHFLMITCCFIHVILINYYYETSKNIYYYTQCFVHRYVKWTKRQKQQVKKTTQINGVKIVEDELSTIFYDSNIVLR